LAIEKEIRNNKKEKRDNAQLWKWQGLPEVQSQNVKDGIRILSLGLKFRAQNGKT